MTKKRRLPHPWLQLALRDHPALRLFATLWMIMKVHFLPSDWINYVKVFCLPKRLAEPVPYTEYLEDCPVFLGLYGKQPNVQNGSKINGRRHGEVTIWQLEKKIATWNFFDGRMQGAFTTYYSSGRVRCTGFLDGKRVGVQSEDCYNCHNRLVRWREYSENGSTLFTFERPDNSDAATLTFVRGRRYEALLLYFDAWGPKRDFEVLQDSFLDSDDSNKPDIAVLPFFFQCWISGAEEERKKIK